MKFEKVGQWLDNKASGIVTLMGVLALDDAIYLLTSEAGEVAR